MLHKKPVKTSILILAFILLLGVISMTLGFYNHNSLFITLGISITFITSLMITLQNILSHNRTQRRIG